MVEIDREDDIEAPIGRRNVFGGRRYEIGARPRREIAPRLGEIERAEIERGDIERRIVALHLAQEASGAAADIEQPGAADAAPRQLPLQWGAGLPPHGGGTAPEQYLDLVVVELGRVPAAVTVGLEMEVLQVITRIAARRCLAENFAVCG